MNCTRCLTTVSPNLSNIQQLNLNHIGVNETLNKLNCDNCQICVYVSMSTEEWKNLDAALHKRKRLGGNGWEVIEEQDELVKLYVLGQVVYNEIEYRVDDFNAVFDFPDKTDLVKILWKDGNAIGFYTLKLKDSIVFDTMEVYGMNTLDTAYIRKAYRRNGFGLSILEDIVDSFPGEDIGISSPVSISMYYETHPLANGTIMYWRVMTKSGTLSLRDRSEINLYFSCPERQEESTTLGGCPHNLRVLLAVGYSQISDD